MNQKIDLQYIWGELEKETVGQANGICKRIASQDAVYRIYLGINCATKARLFIIEFPSEDTSLFDSVTSSKGLLIEISTKGDFLAGCNACVAMSNNTELNSIFTSFAEDVIHVAQQISDRKHYTLEIIRRLKLWKAFFENTGGQGLSQEKQIGLFGELDILQRLITQFGPEAVQYWKGPDSAAQDFQLETSAIEVKSTINEYKTAVMISNIQQLDKDNRSNLYLCFMRYETFLEKGTTLPALVGRILQLISGTKWTDLFNEKLLGQGYFTQDAPKYKAGYVSRNALYFDVTDTFPKIIRKTIPNGIIDVSYSVDLKQCSNYEISFKAICNRP